MGLTIEDAVVIEAADPTEAEHKIINVKIKTKIKLILQILQTKKLTKRALVILMGLQIVPAAATGPRAVGRPTVPTP